VKPEMEIDIIYNNWRSVTLEDGALMEAEGVMAVENDRPLFIADLIRVYPGFNEEGADDPDSENNYAKHCLPLRNTRVHFSGTVSAVPVAKGVDRIFTLHLSTYLRKEDGKSVYSVFDIHCVFPGVTSRWTNTWVPRVGKWTSIQGDIVGEYVFDGRPSLCVVVQNFNPAPSTETTAEAPPEPSSAASVQRTPRTLSRFQNKSPSSPSPAKRKREKARTWKRYQRLLLGVSCWESWTRVVSLLFLFALFFFFKNFFNDIMYGISFFFPFFLFYYYQSERESN